MPKTEPSTDKLIITNQNSASGFSMYQLGPTIPASGPTEAEVKAVYSYIRAIRALGRTGVNTSEIASALSLPLNIVNRAVSALRSQGVEVI